MYILSSKLSLSQFKIDIFTKILSATLIKVVNFYLAILVRVAC